VDWHLAVFVDIVCPDLRRTLLSLGAVFRVSCQANVKFSVECVYGVQDLEVEVKVQGLEVGVGLLGQEFWDLGFGC
jgi:hypothetical protein